jgi:TolA-binding protein
VASSITYHQIFPETANQVRSVAGGERIQASKEGKVVRFQHSLLGLDATSKLAVTTSNDRLNQFELESGIVAAELPRIPNRESLVIRARFLTIRVTGTLFWVEIQDDGYMVIGVLRGHVSVTADEGPTWAVNADEQLVVSDNRTAENEEIARDTAERVQRLLYPEATIPSSPDAVNEETAAENTLEDVDRSDSTASVHSPKAFEQHSLGDIEQWILSKQFVKAERALKRRLKAIQDEPSSLNLLATCYRKQGKYKQAATEYERLATVGGVVSQNRARYTLSVIYQEKLGAHERAVEHLESYLDAPKDARPNTLEARLRLARSLKQLGRLVAYRQTLESIVASYPGTQAADKAKQLLVDAP